MNKLNNPLPRKAILFALKEDIGSGDITTIATVPETKNLQGIFLAKESGVVAGIDIAGEVFKLLDPEIRFHSLVENGSVVNKGQILAKLKGRGRVILTGERVALNLLQRMSGIATITKQYVNAIRGTKAVILDTRKTTPGLRIFDKLAVIAGGGRNHRFGLYDTFLIKDNHIVAAGSITKAVTAVRKYDQKKLSIEVEVKNFKELKEALVLVPDRIMLDNMDLRQIQKAVSITAGRIPLEVSGGVNLSTVAKIAHTGVDFISVGALTHSVKALDISLEIE